MSETFACLGCGVWFSVSREIAEHFRRHSEDPFVVACKACAKKNAALICGHCQNPKGVHGFPPGIHSHVWIPDGAKEIIPTGCTVCDHPDSKHPHATGHNANLDDYCREKIRKSKEEK